MPLKFSTSVTFDIRCSVYGENNAKTHVEQLFGSVIVFSESNFKWLVVMAHMQFSCDDETGEVITYEINSETGEHFIELQPPLLERKTEDSRPKFPRHGYFSKTKKFQSLKANIIAGSNPISHRMLLLPTLMFCPALLCSILMVLEVFLHIRCHKKNKTLKDPNTYYRSPFHMISSSFCGVCRDSDVASKIEQLQDKRRYRYDYFRGIAI